MKKILALLLALALLLPAVAMAELTRVSEEPVEFTFWAAYNPTFQTDWENMKCWKYLEEATGVHIKWELYTLNEMKDKLGITLAGGDPSVLPDAFFPLQYHRYAAEKVRPRRHVSGYQQTGSRVCPEPVPEDGRYERLGFHAGS